MRKSYYNNIHLFALSFFSLFPLLPNRIKGIVVISLFVITLILFIKEKNQSYPYKNVFFFSSLFIIYILSLTYTENFDQIDKLLATRVSLFIVPISFGFLVSTRRLVQESSLIFLSKINIFISTIYSVLILFYLTQLGVFSRALNLNDAMAYVTNEMWGINQHPIYASIFISISILLACIILIKEKKRTTFLFLVIPLIILSFVLLLLARKGVLIALLLSLLVLIIFQINKINLLKFFLKTTILMVIIFLFIAPVKERFTEIFNKETYISITEGNSTSLRIGIYRCVFDRINDSPIFGFGLGDVKNELKKCYKDKSKILFKGNYNSHNQYLSYYLSTGVVGFLLLVIITIYSFYKGYNSKNLFLMTFSVFFGIIMLFENILERQSGVILFTFYICLFSFYNYNSTKFEKET